MATANITNKPKSSELMSYDNFDALSAKLAMLSANLHVIYGEGFASFNNLNDEIRENYIWGCAALADECRGIMARSGGA